LPFITESKTSNNMLFAQLKSNILLVHISIQKLTKLKAYPTIICLLGFLKSASFLHPNSTV
jgi:hypothetical protein